VVNISRSEDATMKVRVVRKRMEATDICSFELVAEGVQELPPFDAGAHVDVHVTNGVVRQYSLCNPPGETHRYVIAVLLDAKSRGGSVAMHTQVSEGDVLTIGPPRNLFALAAESQRNVLFAGGIGVTPILAMAEKLSSENRPFVMHYCTRSRDRTAFMERILNSQLAEHVRFYHGDDAQGKIDIAACLGPVQEATHVYVCGPTGFLDAVTETAYSNGWPEHLVHSERFGAAQPDADGASFEVVLNSSGKRIQVLATETVVDALIRCGISVPTSCEQGVCGTCLTGVIDGIPDHKDVYLSDAERAKNDRFLPCCSRALSPRLVLDL
jgi:vanillate monooxygenase ferredoxin subunit